MGSKSDQKSKKNYEVISNDIRRLYASKNALYQKQKELKTSFSQLSVFVSGRKFSHRFPELERELNNIVENWNVAKPLEILQSQLKGYFDKIAFIDNGISNIENGRQALMQLPDRHNRKSTTDKIDVLLKNVFSISLALLDRVKNEVIPNALRKIKEVQDGFEAENSTIRINKKTAGDLLDRIRTYDNYVDKFDLFKIRANAEHVAKKVIQSPNCISPNYDKAKLQDAINQLDKCDSLFEQEENLFRQIGDNLLRDRSLLWVEDYQNIQDIVREGASQANYTSKELEALITNTKAQKDNDIAKLLTLYNDKVISAFQKEFEYLKSNFVEKKELSKLKKKIDAKIAEDKKNLYLKIVKIVAIAAAVIAFIAIMAMYWPWSGIIVGILVVMFVIMIFKE